MPDVKILASDLGFPEGPVWMADGSVILGEISGRKVTRIAADGGKTEIGKAGGGPNGVATGPDGALYVCNNGGAVYQTTPSFLSTGPAPDYKSGSIQRIYPKTGETRILYSACNGHKLSAPNDIVFDKQGGFYFTDLGKRFAHHRDNGGLYYALPDGSSVTELVYPIVTPNGVGLSPDEKTVYVADTESSRVFAWDIISPGKVKHEPFPAPYGGRCVCGLPGFQRFDSLAVEANGNICVATLVTGYITVISPAFGGPDLRTAYITLSASGQLAAMDWPEPGLRLNFMA
jgi:gluconolactonase